MSQRAFYLCGIVLVLALLSALAEKRERSEAMVVTNAGQKCATCAVYGPRDPRCDTPIP